MQQNIKQRVKRKIQTENELEKNYKETMTS